MSRFLAALALLALASGCSPAISVRLLDPAAVTLPDYVSTIAVVDRSQVTHPGEGFLGAMEGFASGETAGADRAGAEGAVMGLVNALAASPRFSVVQIQADPRAVDSSLFDSLLGWDRVEQICRENGAQALVALESFDSDSELEIETEDIEEEDEDGRVRHRVRYNAQRMVRAQVRWRTYDGSGPTVLDEGRRRGWSEHDRAYGDTREQAVAALPWQAEVTHRLGIRSGEAYGRRIAPSWKTESRPYYGTRDERLEAASRAVLQDDWAGASAIWQQMLSDPDPRWRGRAEFNLALAAEVTGDLPAAREWVGRAVETLRNGRARHYRAVIERRIREDEQLERQMWGEPLPDLPPAGSPEGPSAPPPPPPS